MAERGGLAALDGVAVAAVDAGHLRVAGRGAGRSNDGLDVIVAGGRGHNGLDRLAAVEADELFFALFFAAGRLDDDSLKMRVAAGRIRGFRGGGEGSRAEEQHASQNENE